IMRVTPDGERVWETLTAKTVEGSYSDRITIKTHEVDHDGNPCALYVSGNPVKWFQGHNVFGHNCPHELTVGLLNRLCELLPELTPTDVQRKFWARSEEHTSELQSRENLVCRLLLEKNTTLSLVRP